MATVATLAGPGSSPRVRMLAAALALTSLLWAPIGTAATVVYDNGRPIVDAGYNSVGQSLANDFTLDSTWSIVMLRLYLVLLDPRDLTTAEWAIYTDDQGRPGTKIGGATATTELRTLIGSTDYLGLYQVDLPLSEALTLNAGHYWLALHTPSYGSVFWSDSTERGTQNRMYYDAYELDEWQGLQGESAFQIIAVPEPQQAASLALGLAVLYAVGRRSRRAKQRA